MSVGVNNAEDEKVAICEASSDEGRKCGTKSDKEGPRRR